MAFPSSRRVVECVVIVIVLSIGSPKDRLVWAEIPTPTLESPFHTVDMAIGETTDVTLVNGTKVTLKLVDLIEQRDVLRNAVRRSEVTVEVNGNTVQLVSATYRRPITVGNIQIDCPITGGYTANSTKTTGNLAPWGLRKDARLRIWPANSPIIQPRTFRYPAKQAWFASATQMANEPTYVDGGERPGTANVYYHYGLDIGGAEGHVDVIAATDGLVVSVGKEVLEGYKDSPVAPRYDVVYLLDQRGWFYRYSHLQSIHSDLCPGKSIKIGDPIGVLGKEGGSGGWSHLHFDISGRQPSGDWGIIDGYAFLWEAYVREYDPKIIAVARPHYFVSVGDKVGLDGNRSWSASGKITSYEWTYGDGSKATGANVTKTYDKPGVYSEILKVTDADGRIDVDFAIVNVVDKGKLDELPPSIHAAYSPTFDIRTGQPVKFFVRTFRTTDGEETWNFGDGSPTTTVQSDGNVVALAKDGYAITTHAYDHAGTFIVKVHRTDRRGYTATAHLKVTVK